MKRLLLGLAVVAGAFSGVHGQGLPDVDWQKRLGGNRNDIPFSFAATQDGGYVILGTTISDAGNGDVTVRKGTSNPHTIKDYWVVKLDAAGAIEWDSTFGGDNSEEEMGQIIQTSDGGYILAGGTYSSNVAPGAGGGNRAIWVIKLDAQGRTTWDESYGTTREDYARTIIPTADGGYLIGGAVALPSSGGPGGPGGPGSLGGGPVRAITLKIDGTGNEVWWKQYDDLSDTTTDITSLMAKPGGGYTLIGRSGRPSSSTSMAKTQVGDYLVGKLDDQGDKVWSRVLGGTRFDYLNGGFQTADGGIVLCGHTHSEDNDLDGIKKHADDISDLWIVKVNAAGDSVLWSKSYGGGNADSIAYITRTLDGGAIIAANTKSSADGDVSGTNKGKTDVWILKLDPNGELEWEENFGGGEDDVVRGLIAHDDGSFAILGTTGSTDGDLTGTTGKGDLDYWIVKFEAPTMDSMVVRVKDNLQPKITTAAGTLQLEALVYPTMLPQQFVWSVTPGSGTATVDANGLVTAGDSGTVWVKAEWAEDNTVIDSVEITIDVAEEEENPGSVYTTSSGEQSIRVYPNPAKGYLMLHAVETHPEMQLALYDLTGRIVYRTSVEENSLLQPMQVNISSVPSGVYLLELQAAGATITQRVSIY